MTPPAPANWMLPAWLVRRMAAPAPLLNAASIAGSKVLITDGGANGLRSDDMTDSANTGGRVVRFGGDWSGQQLSQSDYTALFAETDTDYMRMLRALLAQVN